MAKPDGNIQVIYDKECPICNRFAASIAGTPNLELNNGREDSRLLRRAQNLRLDIDRGLIVYGGDKFYHGAEAFEFIAGNVKTTGFIGIVNRYLMRHKLVARLSYPLFVAARRFLLLLLRKPLIQEDTKPYRR